MLGERSEVFFAFAESLPSSAALNKSAAKLLKLCRKTLVVLGTENMTFLTDSTAPPICTSLLIEFCLMKNAKVGNENEKPK